MNGNQQYPSISEGFKEVGGNLRDSIPHIMIPTPGDKKPGNNPSKKPMFTPKQEGFLNELKKWAFILAITVVVGYAIYRIFFA